VRILWLSLLLSAASLAACTKQKEPELYRESGYFTFRGEKKWTGGAAYNVDQMDYWNVNTTGKSSLDDVTHQMDIDFQGAPRMTGTYRITRYQDTALQQTVTISVSKQGEKGSYYHSTDQDAYLTVSIEPFTGRIVLNGSDFWVRNDLPVPDSFKCSIVDLKGSN
jgi:hypothetical protein